MRPIEKKKVQDELERRAHCCERVADDLRNKENRDYYLGKAEAYREMISFLEPPSPSEDLEAEFERFLDDAEGVPRMYHSDEQIEWGKDIARHFAQWQKEQMMKKAVDVVVWDAGVEFAPHPCISVEDFNLKDGDKVKIIIIKED